VIDESEIRDAKESFRFTVAIVSIEAGGMMPSNPGWTL
jgi:hypothetical protein